MATRETDTLAILFADIAKSTNLYETLGDKIAQNLIGRCLSLFSEVTTQYHGTVIKTIGDEIMCTFPTADYAVEAGMKMHLALEELPVVDRPGYPPPNIYVGIQWGPVVREGNDVFGDAVNVAARMVAFAKQRQIITTEQTVNALSKEHQASARCIDKTTIKGKSGEISIYEVIWERQDVTVMVEDSLDAMTLKARMEIRFHDQLVEVDENRPSASLGRQSHNEIVVNDNRVSRSHARIEYRRGKFVLIDQSTNGTYVIIQGKKKLSLKRDEAQLLGNGVISLGREADPDSPTAIHYVIKL
jgi:class 3 adenylate cyclase